MESDFRLSLQATEGIFFFFLYFYDIFIASQIPDQHMMGLFQFGNYLISPEKTVSFLQFSGRALEITVWDYDKVGSSEFIGEVRGSVTIQAELSCTPISA